MYKVHIAILQAARHLIATGGMTFICNAVKGASGYYGTSDCIEGDEKELESAGADIRAHIMQGLSMGPAGPIDVESLEGWLCEQGFRKSFLTDDRMVQCRLTWIDRMIDDYSMEESCPAPK